MKTLLHRYSVLLVLAVGLPVAAAENKPAAPYVNPYLAASSYAVTHQASDMTPLAGPSAASKLFEFADYSKRDHEIVDYEFYSLPELPRIGFRGPPVDGADLSAGRYFTVIGAAQSLGVYVQHPYPNLLADKIGLPCLNLSLGGINPGFYADQPALIQRVNKGRFVILQVLTARAEPNDRLEPVGIAQLKDKKTGEISIPEALWAKVLVEDRNKLPLYVKQNQQAWEQAYRRLISQIKVPIVLFYFSYKPENEQVNYHATSLKEFFGHYPQFVETENVKRIAALCQAYAKCDSRRNMGHRLVSRFTGEPVEIDMGMMHPDAKGTTSATHNLYYPSAEMHEDAVGPLSAALKKLGLVH